MQRIRSCLLFVLLALPINVRAAGPVDYRRDVKPILRARCYSCHGALKQESSLRLDTAELAAKGGESGQAIVPGDAQQSLLVERITDPDGSRMPPEGEPLTAEQIATIRRWINQGAVAPADEEPQIDSREHWAFQPPVMAQPPEADGEGAGRGLIDRLVGRVHDRLGLTRAPRADRGILLRRVSLDLVGLPPTAEQLERFLNDTSDAAYERVVAELLESPQYGERWGRHWMDVWRYADWSGEINNQVRGSPRHIWRWRDWIVESLNEDKGYDQMVREMLAGDEIAPDDPQALRATGFLARNWYKFNRNVWLDDTVEHTAKAFLGLTLNCAKCHDHKYDPISQKNYYQFRAFFEPHDVRTDPVPSEKDIKKDGLVRVFDAQPDTPTYVFHRGDESQPDTSNPLSPRLPKVLGGRLTIVPVSLPEQPEQTDQPSHSTGRQSALADWITDRQNPLTARVAVNHVWTRHFGTPLVESMTDFGLRTPRPELADVLDSLAVDLMDHGWSMKHLHRQIVLSDLYQMQSGFPSPDNTAIDRDNRLLWRMNRRRMEAEAVRDSVLYLAGTLDLSRGGREIPLDQADASVRRSMYFRHGHERQIELLQTFDGASVLECYRRNQTVVPQQALALSNNVLIREQSRTIAANLASTKKTGRDFIQAAFRHVLSRPPSTDEAARCEDFLQKQRGLVERGELTYAPDAPLSKRAPSADPQQRARASLVHVLLNHNDFITIR